MIFVTVGGQMSFDRLIAGVDTWARQRERRDVFAQIGPSTAPPSFIPWTAMLTPAQFSERLRSCTAVVAHAGMGTILSCLQAGVPLLVMPRIGSLGETRNDHQVATATRFRELGKVAVAMNENDLSEALDRLDDLRAAEPIAPHASEELLGALRRFITAPRNCSGQRAREEFLNETSLSACERSDTA